MSTLTQFFGSGGGGSTGIPCELLVIGGGGGGDYMPQANGTNGGGGGAGRLVFSRTVVPFGYSWTVTVGAGGAVNTTGTRSWLGLSLSAGGGANGKGGSDLTTNGGSAGGAGTNSGYAAYNQGTCSATIHSFDYISAASAGYPSVYVGYGGGAGGMNGAGLDLDITGTLVTYAEGGKRAVRVNGAPNTGTGGSGGPESPSQNSAGTGGSGIVVVAYPDTYAIPSAITGTYNEPTRSGYRVYRFTGSGSITLPAA